jgi:hypothetical protein
MKELSTKAAEILRAAQQCETPSAAVRTRVWEQMKLRAVAGDLGPELPELVEPTTSSVVSTKLLGWIAAAAVGGGAVVAGIATRGGEEAQTRPATVVHEPAHASEPETPPEEAPSLVVPLPEPTEPPSATPEEAASEPAVQPKPAKRASPKPQTKATSVPEQENAPSFAEEVELMGRARAALGRNDAAGALALLEQHAKTFPRGALGPERDVSRIMALCALGREAQARKRAVAFMRNHAGSALAERVRRTCVGDDLP